MPDTLQTLSLITLAQEYRGDTVRQINRRVTLLKMLRIVPEAALNVAWAPEADGMIGENYAEGADASNYGSDAQASAVLNWGHYRSNFHVSGTAMAAAAGAASPIGNRMLWARNQRNAAAKLADTVEKALFNGAGTGTTISGLDVAVANNANVYATIDRTISPANTYFQPTVVDPGTLTAITFAQIRDDLQKIFLVGGEYPDLAVCSPAVFNSVANLFDANRRWTVVNTARGKINLDAGYEGVEVDGCMFVKAKDATANRIYYLNTNHVEIVYLPPIVPAGVQMNDVNADDGYGPVPLGFAYEMLAKTGDSDKAMVTSKMNLRVNRPNTCGSRLHVAA